MLSPPQFIPRLHYRALSNVTIRRDSLPGPSLMSDTDSSHSSILMNPPGKVVLQVVVFLLLNQRQGEDVVNMLQEASEIPTVQQR